MADPDFPSLKPWIYPSRRAAFVIVGTVFLVPIVTLLGLSLR